MSDDEDDDPSGVVKRALVDPSGGFRIDRAVRALRGRRSTETDLVPWLAATLVGAFGFGVLAGYHDFGTVVDALGFGGVMLLTAAFVLAVFASDRVESYYADDEDVAVEELRARYARGEMDLETFQRRVDRVHEEGPEFVWSEDEGDDQPVAEDRADGDDPVAILRRRFAEGALTEEEYRSRVAALEETMDGEAGDEREPERTGELDRARADERE